MNFERPKRTNAPMKPREIKGEKMARVLISMPEKFLVKVVLYETPK